MGNLRGCTMGAAECGCCDARNPQDGDTGEALTSTLSATPRRPISVHQFNTAITRKTLPSISEDPAAPAGVSAAEGQLMHPGKAGRLPSISGEEERSIHLKMLSGALVDMRIKLDISVNELRKVVNTLNQHHPECESHSINKQETVVLMLDGSELLDGHTLRSYEIPADASIQVLSARIRSSSNAASLDHYVEVKVPSVDLKVKAAKMPSVECEVKVPSVECEVKVPSVDVEVKAPKMPSVECEVKVPSVECEVKVPSVDVEVKAPKAP